MTLAQALTLEEGSIVYSPAELQSEFFGKPKIAERRISKVWVNAARTIVRVRIASYGSKMADEWLDPAGFEMYPPKEVQA